jgi:hypothetical protein
MVNMFASNVIDPGCSPRSGPVKDYAIGICCFSAKHAALRSKRRYWLVRIRIICQRGAKCLSADCCFTELAI